jgi:hypothetical protein
MSAQALVERALRNADVEAAALFGVDRSVLHRGFGADAPALSEVAATLRHVFRETSPAVRSLDLRFAEGRILALPVEEDVLIVRAKVDASIEGLLASLDAARTAERVHIDTSTRSGTAHAPAPMPMPLPAPASVPDAALALEALDLLVARARGSLGGPVVRNYLKKSRERLGAPEALRPFEIELSGKITLRDPTTLREPGTLRAVGRWARAFLELAGAVAPDLGAEDLRALLGPISEPLGREGFFDAE